MAAQVVLQVAVQEMLLLLGMAVVLRERAGADGLLY
jgi:hypothetical protein